MGRARQSPARRFCKIVSSAHGVTRPACDGARVTRPSGFGDWNWSWKGCKPNSVCPEFLRGREPFVCAADTRNPFRFRETWSGPLRDSLFGLAPDGVFRAASLALRAVRSYRTFSPLPAPLAKRRRFDFLWHCPSKSLSTFRPRVSQPNEPELRGIAPFGVRTFLPRPAVRDGSDSPPFQNHGQSSRKVQN